MLDARRHGQVDVGHHALVQQQDIDGHALGRSRATTKDHAVDAVGAFRAEHRDARQHAHMPAHGCEQPQSLAEIRWGDEAAGIRQRGAPGAAIRRVENGLDAPARLQELVGEKPKQRTRAGKHDAAGWH